MIIAPQEGFQTKFLSSKADIVFGGSGAGCFTENTLVKTINGYRNIQDVIIGDYVLSYNELTKSKEYKQVVQTLVHNTVATNKKMIIFTFNNGIKIKCTENHEFYFRGDWIEARELVRRKMGLCSKHARQIYNINAWKNRNAKLEKQREVFNNETCLRYKRVLQNDVKNVKKWRVSFSYSKNSSVSTRMFFRKSSREKYGKSYRYEPKKQSHIKFRVGNSKREFLPLIEKYGKLQQKYRSNKEFKAFKRLSNWNVNFKRITSFRDKTEIQTNNIHKGNVSERVQRFDRMYKRSSELQNLEAFEINLNNISKIEIIKVNETVYDLSVIDNNNYFVSENDILVHNCGKTWSLLVEPIRHNNTNGFNGVFFRRETPQITNPGGLLDESKKIYPLLGATKAHLDWRFPNGNRIVFRHLQYEDDKYSWQGTELCYIAFDELTHFTKGQFLYLMSRNRSTCGVKPYIRATCNPDPDSWVADFIDWYIDQDSGFPIPERIGKLRYFMVNEDNIIWGDSYDDVYEKNKTIIDIIIQENKNAGGDDLNHKDLIKSFTFITGSIYENKALMKTNPQYLASLLALDKEQQMQLLYGNWKKVTNDNEMYNYTAFCDMFGSLKHCRTGVKRITADIAMQGADKYIIGVWDGNELVDIEIIDKTDGKMVVDSITRMAQLHSVNNSNIIYDNDGVGSYLGGFILNGIGFNNNRTPIGIGKKAYTNLKSQCYFTSAQYVNDGKYSIADNVANKMYDSKQTVKQRFLFERKAIRKARPDMDNKLSPIRKDEMKGLLGGQSPDIMDMFMMHAYFDLGQKL